MASNPASASFEVYSVSCSAPAMHPTHSSTLSRTCRGTSPCTTTSNTAKRPPGFSTRKASRSPRSLSAERLMTQLEIITSTELSDRGIFSISPLRNSTFSTPALRWFSRARASISSVMSSPYALPVGPTRCAESSTSMPPPEPRSRTVSPGLSSAKAVGLPQPSEAFTASSGIWLVWLWSYRLVVMGSQQLSSAVDAPQHELPLLCTRSAACPYFSFTTSLISVLMMNLLFAQHNDLFRFDCLVAGAALGIKETEQFLQRLSIGGVPQEGAVAADLHQAFILELVEMMGECRAGDLQFAADVAHHHSVGMRRQQQLHDAQPRLGPHGRKHVGIAGNLFWPWFLRHDYLSTIP